MDNKKNQNLDDKSLENVSGGLNINVPLQTGLADESAMKAELVDKTGLASGLAVKAGLVDKTGLADTLALSKDDKDKKLM